MCTLKRLNCIELNEKEINIFPLFHLKEGTATFISQN